MLVGSHALHSESTFSVPGVFFCSQAIVFHGNTGRVNRGAANTIQTRLPNEAAGVYLEQRNVVPLTQCKSRYLCGTCTPHFNGCFFSDERRSFFSARLSWLAR